MPFIFIYVFLYKTIKHITLKYSFYYFKRGKRHLKSNNTPIQIKMKYTENSKYTHMLKF